MQKTFVIAGATSGIGLAVARDLVQRGMNVIGIGRSVERCEQAASLLREISPTSCVRFLLADLSLLQQVREAAWQVRQTLAEWNIQHLDGLLNNAGTVPFHQTTTTEGFDKQWALNYLSGFLLTHLLLDDLLKAPQGRIVSVSSSSHYFTRLAWNNLQSIRCYNPLLSYKRSKLAQVMFIKELDDILSEKGNVRAFAAEPGLVNTDIGSKGDSMVMKWFWSIRRRSGISPHQAAEGITYLLLEPSIQSSPHVYWHHSHPKKPNALVENGAVRKKLWTLSKQMCEL